jgi:hypothetical protein
LPFNPATPDGLLLTIDPFNSTSEFPAPHRSWCPVLAVTVKLIVVCTPLE